VHAYRVAAHKYLQLLHFYVTCLFQPVYLPSPTHVMFPGILYGAGESDDQLHLLWRAAWEGQQPLQVHGPGHNRLPTLHVTDLAAFCAAVALQEPQEQQQQQQQLLQGRPPAQQQQQQPQGKYWVAVDAAHVTQRQLVEGIGQLLVHTGIRYGSRVSL